MFDPYSRSDIPSTGELLAEIGIDRHTVREVSEDDRAIRCPDRDSVHARPHRRGPRPPHALRAGTARGGAPGPPRPVSRRTGTAERSSRRAFRE